MRSVRSGQSRLLDYINHTHLIHCSGRMSPRCMTRMRLSRYPWSRCQPRMGCMPPIRSFQRMPLLGMAHIAPLQKTLKLSPLDTHHTK